ncbi:MAG: hypothetical protein WA303_13115 [Bradyrhizobium sp.]|jgi:hypothetical protein
MSDSNKDFAARLAAEAVDSANLFFRPVRVIVKEFSKAIGYGHPHRESSEHEKPVDNVGTRVG